MSDKLRIALLCNNKMAGIAAQRMASEGALCAIATADTDAEVVHLFRSLSQQFSVPYTRLTAGDSVGQLIAWLQDVRPDVVFVMAFPWKITAEILAVPRLGFLNFHPGLLPQMRGADPIFETIRQRMPVGGVAVHVMDEGLDSGPVIMQEEIPVGPEYTYGMLASQAGYVIDKMCKDLVAKGPEEMVLGVAQDESKAKYWPKVGEAELTLNWQEMDSKAIMAVVRACNPIARGVPVSINGWKIGVCDCSEVNLQGDASSIKPGTIVAMDVANGLIVYCKDGKGVKLDVVYTGEGVFPGYKLAFFGIGNGMMFG